MSFQVEVDCCKKNWNIFVGIFNSMKSQACTKNISYESQAYSIKLCMVTCSNGIEVKKTFDFTYLKSKVALYCLGRWLFTNMLVMCTTSFYWLYSINIYVEVKCCEEFIWDLEEKLWKICYWKPICTSSIYLMCWFVVASHTTWYSMAMILTLKP